MNSLTIPPERPHQGEVAGGGEEGHAALARRTEWLLNVAANLIQGKGPLPSSPAPPTAGMPQQGHYGPMPPGVVLTPRSSTPLAASAVPNHAGPSFHIAHPQQQPAQIFYPTSAAFGPPEGRPLSFATNSISHLPRATSASSTHQQWSAPQHIQPHANDDHARAVPYAADTSAVTTVVISADSSVYDPPPPLSAEDGGGDWGESDAAALTPEREAALFLRKWRSASALLAASPSAVAACPTAISQRNVPPITPGGRAGEEASVPIGRTPPRATAPPSAFLHVANKKVQVEMKGALAALTAKGTQTDPTRCESAAIATETCVSLRADFFGADSCGNSRFARYLARDLHTVMATAAAATGTRKKLQAFRKKRLPNSRCNSSTSTTDSKENDGDVRRIRAIGGQSPRECTYRNDDDNGGEELAALVSLTAECIAALRSRCCYAAGGKDSTLRVEGRYAVVRSVRQILTGIVGDSFSLDPHHLTRGTAGSSAQTDISTADLATFEGRFSELKQYAQSLEEEVAFLRGAVDDEAAAAQQLKIKAAAEGEEERGELLAARRAVRDLEASLADARVAHKAALAAAEERCATAERRLAEAAASMRGGLAAERRRVAEVMAALTMHLDSFAFPIRDEGEHKRSTDLGNGQAVTPLHSHGHSPRPTAPDIFVSSSRDHGEAATAPLFGGGPRTTSRSLSSELASPQSAAHSHSSHHTSGYNSGGYMNSSNSGYNSNALPPLSIVREAPRPLGDRVGAPQQATSGQTASLAGDLMSRKWMALVAAAERTVASQKASLEAAFESRWVAAEAALAKSVSNGGNAPSDHTANPHAGHTAEGAHGFAETTEEEEKEAPAATLIAHVAALRRALSEKTAACAGLREAIAAQSEANAAATLKAQQAHAAELAAASGRVDAMAQQMRDMVGHVALFAEEATCRARLEASGEAAAFSSITALAQKEAVVLLQSCAVGCQTMDALQLLLSASATSVAALTPPVGEVARLSSEQQQAPSTAHRHLSFVSPILGGHSDSADSFTPFSHPTAPAAGTSHHGLFPITPNATPQTAAKQLRVSFAPPPHIPSGPYDASQATAIANGPPTVVPPLTLKPHPQKDQHIRSILKPDPSLFTPRPNHTHSGPAPTPYASPPVVGWEQRNSLMEMLRLCDEVLA